MFNELQMKEIKISVPETLYDINIAGFMVFSKIIKDKGMGDLDKAVEIIAGLNDIPTSDVRALDIKVINELAAKIINLFYKDSREYSLDSLRQITVDGVEYGLEPNFDKIETGAYIDLTDLLEDIEANLHKIMAILYRPIAKRHKGLYKLTTYSDEDDRIKAEREETFLKHMPYAVVRAVVNFMWSHIRK